MSDFIAPNSETAIQEAAKNGFVCEFPKANELQLDFDDAASVYVWKRHRQIVEQYWGIESETWYPSKSGLPDKLHLVVALLTEVSNLERVALQAMLGSDRMREILSLIQVSESDPHPTLFVEKPNWRDMKL